MAFIETLISFMEALKTVLLYGWPFIILLWLMVLKFRYKNWPVEAIIIEKRDNNLIKTNDRAGKYIDKYTGIIGYKLQKSKDTMPVPEYDWVMHNVFKPTTLSERVVALIRGNIGTIFLYRYGSKQYKPIKIKEGTKIKTVWQTIKDSNGEDSIIRIYQPVDLRDKLGALDFEVIDWDNMNFMVQEQRASIERRKKQKEWLMTVALPLLALALTVVLCIIMIKFAYDYSLNIKTPPASNIPQEAAPPNIPVISDVLPGT